MKKTIQLTAIIIVMICGSFKLNAQCNIYTSPNQTFCCGPAVVQLTAALTSTYCNCTNYSYVWSPTVGLSNPYIANPTATVNANTNYVVCITAYRKPPCTAVCCVVCQTVSIYVNGSCCRVTGLSEPTANLTDIKIFPNPAKSNITIDINTALNNSDIFIYDVSGRIVWQKNAVMGKDKIDVSVSDLPRGIYFIKVLQQDKEVYNNKIILE